MTTCGIMQHFDPEMDDWPMYAERSSTISLLTIF